MKRACPTLADPQMGWAGRPPLGRHPDSRGQERLRTGLGDPVPRAGSPSRVMTADDRARGLVAGEGKTGAPQGAQTWVGQGEQRGRGAGREVSGERGLSPEERGAAWHLPTQRCCGRRGTPTERGLSFPPPPPTAQQGVPAPRGQPGRRRDCGALAMAPACQPLAARRSRRDRAGARRPGAPGGGRSRCGRRARGFSRSARDVRAASPSPAALATEPAARAGEPGWEG